MVRTKDKTELFEKTSIPKAVVNLAIPMIAAMLVMVLYNLADTYFVGKLNDSNETGAVTLAAPVLLAFNAVNNIFGIGCSSLMSRALGTKDYDTVKVTSCFGFYAAIVSGVLFSTFCTVFKTPLFSLLGVSAENYKQTSDYMFWTVTCGAAPSILNVVMAQIVRAEGQAMLASIGTMSGCFINILLDPVFILPFGLNMGASGAGLATFISNSTACIYYIVLVCVRKNKSYISISPVNLKLKRHIVAGVCGVGLPAAVQNLLNVTGMTVLNSFMSEYGSDAIAAIGISHKMSMIPMYAAMGLAQGIMPLVGYNYASKNYKRMKEAVFFTAKISITGLAVSTALYCVFSANIIELFMKEEAVVLYGTVFIKGQSLAMFFLVVDFLAVGVFQACGMGKMSLIFAILRKIVLEIPALIILNKLFPMYGLAFAGVVAEIVLSITAAVCLSVIFKKLTP